MRQRSRKEAHLKEDETPRHKTLCRANLATSQLSTYAGQRQDAETAKVDVEQ